MPVWKTGNIELKNLKTFNCHLYLNYISSHIYAVNLFWNCIFLKHKMEYEWLKCSLNNCLIFIDNFYYMFLRSFYEDKKRRGSYKVWIFRCSKDVYFTFSLRNHRAVLSYLCTQVLHVDFFLHAWPLVDGGGALPLQSRNSSTLKINSYELMKNYFL